jgi:hypothetical protein
MKLAYLKIYEKPLDLFKETMDRQRTIGIHRASFLRMLYQYFCREPPSLGEDCLETAVVGAVIIACRHLFPRYGLLQYSIFLESHWKCGPLSNQKNGEQRI